MLTCTSASLSAMGSCPAASVIARHSKALSSASHSPGPCEAGGARSSRKSSSAVAPRVAAIVPRCHAACRDTSTTCSPARVSVSSSALFESAIARVDLGRTGRSDTCFAAFCVLRSFGAVTARHRVCIVHRCSTAPSEAVGSGRDERSTGTQLQLKSQSPSLSHSHSPLYFSARRTPRRTRSIRVRFVLTLSMTLEVGLHPHTHTTLPNATSRYLRSPHAISLHTLLMHIQIQIPSCSVQMFRLATSRYCTSCMSPHALTLHVFQIQFRRVQFKDSPLLAPRSSHKQDSRPARGVVSSC